MWNYHNRHKGLFADYINFFLKGKQEVAGWPANCTTPESRQKYLDDYFEREGIRLNPSKIGETKNHTLSSLQIGTQFLLGQVGRKPRPSAEHDDTRRKRFLGVSRKRRLDGEKILSRERRHHDATLSSEENRSPQQKERVGGSRSKAVVMDTMKFLFYLRIIEMGTTCLSTTK